MASSLCWNTETVKRMSTGFGAFLLNVLKVRLYSDVLQRPCVCEWTFDRTRSRILYITRYTWGGCVQLHKYSWLVYCWWKKKIIKMQFTSTSENLWCIFSNIDSNFQKYLWVCFLMNAWYHPLGYDLFVGLKALVLALNDVGFFILILFTCISFRWCCLL